MSPFASALRSWWKSWRLRKLGFCLSSQRRTALRVFSRRPEAIFGARAGRTGAELKVMAAIEAKLPPEAQPLRSPTKPQTHSLEVFLHQEHHRPLLSRSSDHGTGTKPWLILSIAFIPWASPKVLKVKLRSRKQETRSFKRPKLQPRTSGDATRSHWETKSFPSPWGRSPREPKELLSSTDPKTLRP